MSRRHVLVTGGGTGVGRAVAERLVADGYAVTIVGRRAEPLEAVADSNPKALLATTADVTNESSLAEAFQAAERRFGPPFGVVANAGAARSGPLDRVSLDAWNQMLGVNLTGAFLTARAALPTMLERREGRIVFISSTAGLKGYAYVAPYCAAKHGVVGLMRALAQETAAKGVTVNAVCPGYTETPMLEATLENISRQTGRTLEEARASVLSGNPQRRFVLPSEVAGAVAWLLTDEARSTTGHSLSMSGGEI